jgi:transcriptional regulator with XRE-family HTH domain
MASHAKPNIKKTGPRRKDKNVVGKAVMRLRVAQDLSRALFAARAQVVGLNLSPHAVKRIERGERAVLDLELRRLAKALRVPIGVFLEQSGISQDDSTTVV